jgi:hypothetical protein
MLKKGWKQGYSYKYYVVNSKGNIKVPRSKWKRKPNEKSWCEYKI